jgi:hypothetical protein
MMHDEKKYRQDQRRKLYCEYDADRPTPDDHIVMFAARTIDKIIPG